MTDNPVAVIVNTLGGREMQRELQAFLPPNVDPKKFIQTAISAVQRAAHVIAQCDKQSVYNAIADAATKGLMPDGRQGALVPYRERVKVGPNRDDYRWVTKCQFLIMPEGIIEVAARNGATVYAVSVYEGDTVRLWNDAAGQHFEHNYNPFGDRGAMVGAVAVGRARNGAVYVEAVNGEDIAKIKAASKQKDDQGNMRGPWADWEDRMWQKSALHRLHKRMPGIPIEEDAEYTGERTFFRVEPAPAPGLTQSPAETKSLPPATDVPRGTAAPPTGRPRGLQRMVDASTGEVYESGGGESPTSASTKPSEPAPAPPPPDAPPARGGRPKKEDPF